VNQIVLSDRAAADLAQIDRLEQLQIVGEFSRLRRETLRIGRDGIGEIHKGHRTLYRSRFKEYRIYFEKKDDQLLVHHLLHSNTLRDFFVRSNLDVQNDDQFEESAKFWKFLDQRAPKVRTDEPP